MKGKEIFPGYNYCKVNILFPINNEVGRYSERRTYSTAKQNLIPVIVTKISVEQF